MHLVQTPHTTDLTSLSDYDLEAFFDSVGITLEVVDHCGTADCTVCFPELVAKAA